MGGLRVQSVGGRYRSDTSPAVVRPSRAFTASRGLTLSIVAIATIVVGFAALLWFDDARVTANNPSTTVLGTANVDPSEPAPTGVIGVDSTPVYEALEANGLYYIAGDFDEVGGEVRHGLAAINVATGHVDPTFAPVISGSAGVIDAIALSPDEADLYIGGRFTQVDGTFRVRIAKLDAVTGQLDTTFNANINAQVDSIETDGTSVWAAGTFTAVNGQAADNLVKLDATTGALDPAWVGTADRRVRDVELDVNNVLWVGGNFDNIAGTSIGKLAALDPATGNVLTSWSPGLATHGTLEEMHNVYNLSTPPDGSAVYVGTQGTPSAFPQGGNAVRKYATDGELLWQNIGAGDTQSIEATNNTVFAGGHGNFVYTEARYLLDGAMNPNFPTNGFVESDTNTNAVRRNKLWSLDAVTGDINLNWDPNLDSTDGVWGLQSGPSGLLVGGDFRNIFNPDGIEPGGESGVFSPHFAVFAGEGNLGNPAPQALFTFDCAATQCNFDASTSFDDGSIASYTWDFGNGTTATGVQASATLANNATHNVTLTVTDNAGLTSTFTQNVLLGTGSGLPISHVATTATAGNFSSASRQIPAAVQTDDVAIAFVSVSQAGVTVTPPPGWTQFGNEVDGNLRTFAFWTALNATDATSTQTFDFGGTTAKFDLTLSVFRGTFAANPIAAVAASSTTARTAQHTAPALSFANDASVLHYWAERTGDSTQIFASPELATLSTTTDGAGGGRVNATLAIDPTLATATSSPRAAVTEHNSGTALGLSVALRDSATPDTTDPSAAVTSPADGSTVAPGLRDIEGTATDDLSGVSRVRVRIQQLGTANFWDGTAFTPGSIVHDATLNGDGTWTYPNINFPSGDYRIRLIATDNAGNTAPATQNPNTIITVVADTTDPSAAVTSPADGSTVAPGLRDIEGTATDDLSGVSRVRVRIQQLGTANFWDGTAFTPGSIVHDATLNGDGTWTYPNINFPSGDYRIRLIATDNAGNTAPATQNPNTIITVQ